MDNLFMKEAIEQIMEAEGDVRGQQTAIENVLDKVNQAKANQAEINVMKLQVVKAQDVLNRFQKMVNDLQWYVNDLQIKISKADVELNSIKEGTNDAS